MKQAPTTLLIVTLIVTAVALHARAEDWPMWRHDATRSAQTPEQLPEDLHLLWTRQLPSPKPAFREPRIQFDAGYEPIVADKTLFVASNVDDRVSAYSTETGELIWTYFTGGPVRLAPVAWKGRLFFGSDDGCLYCLDAGAGKLHWKFRAVPSNRKILGNGRLISVWPVRGGPVVHDGRVYFAAGVFPFEGVFLYALDAESGEVVWRNDESGYLYGQHPHAAEALGGVTPQGYLVASGNELIVPCGQAVPARYDLKTGKLLAFELPKPGRLPGGWFVSTDVRRGEVVQDATVNRDLHEDKTYQGPGADDVYAKIRVGDRELHFADGLPGVDGEIHSMLAADGKLFGVSRDGVVYAFGTVAPSQAIHHALQHRPVQSQIQPNNPLASRAISLAGRRHGYAIVLGIDDESALDRVLDGTAFDVIAFDSNANKIDRLRRRYSEDGLYGDRIALSVSEPGQLYLPPYVADLTLVSNTSWLDEASFFEVLRPYGGTACLGITDDQHKHFQETGAFPDWLTVTRDESLTVLRREGAPAGAANYTGGWTSQERRVKAPLGLLWFDDTLSHFKRSPQPMFVDGLMLSYSKDWMARHREGRKVPYDLLPPVLSDVYTGRVLSDEEQTRWLPQLPSRERTGQPNQYRPPSQTDDWNPKKPEPGRRINPLTGEEELRTFPKSYGCDGGVDYGDLYTMRSGTAAFYDKRIESGTCYISGPRSGCTNSIIPACGLLNVPYFYEGCTCSYPLPCGLALVSMPPQHEQWAAWGEAKVENIRQVGINFGAPGDRVTESGTLWLDYPSRGGPSPEVRVEVEPDTLAYRYQHSLWMEGGDAWPWVAASVVEGAHTVRISGLRKAEFTVRLVFADPDCDKPGERVFDVVVNGKAIAQGYDIAKVAGGSMRSAILETDNVAVDGTLEIQLTARAGQPVLSGIELVSPK